MLLFFNMDFTVLLLCCLLAVTHSRHLDLKLPTLPVSRIVGGVDAFPGQFPHQVSLQIEWKPFVNASHFCGGTILSERWILTAGHCIKGYEQLPLPVFTFLVKAGKHDLKKEEASEQVSEVEKYFTHERYYEILGTAANDIALIKLRTPLKFNDRVGKAVLPKKNSEPSGQITISGWGSTAEDPENPVDPEVLQTQSLPVIDREACRKAVKNIMDEEEEQSDQELVLESNVCTGPLTGGISPCVGDSGGPLVSTNDKGETEILGITSWTMAPCGRKGAPGVFVRVSSYIDWIEDIINKN